MTTLYRYKSQMGLVLNACCALVLLGLGACAIQEGTDPNNDGSISVAVADTSNIDLNFDNLTALSFTDSGEFNLDEIRARLNDKGIKPDSVKITGLNVTYSDSTAAFLAANKGVHYVLKVYTREGTGPKLLTLETGSEAAGMFATLSFDPKMVLFELNKQIFGNAEGFPGVLSAIKDLSKHSIKVIAELTLKDSLKTTGVLKLNMVVTVAGKV